MKKKAQKSTAKKAAKPAPQKTVVAKKSKASAGKKAPVKKKSNFVAAKKKAAPVKAKAPGKKTKSPASKIKGSAAGKNRKAVQQKAVKAKAKAPVKITKKVPVAKSKNKVAKKPAKPEQQQVSTPILTHGSDQHFIPVHDKNTPVTAPNPQVAEAQFHHNEETALHQENQKAKANMASRMGSKRVFRILGG